MSADLQFHRRSIRLKNYDYSSFGYYFVTICSQNRVHRFGDIVNDEMVLNEIGLMIDKWYQFLPSKFITIRLDEYVIMPNHFHGIIHIIVGADQCVRPNNHGCVRPNNHGCVRPSISECVRLTDQNEGTHIGVPLPKIIQWFKTMTTNEYIHNVKINNWPPFNKKLWQRNYWEHVVRDDGDLKRIRRYIDENPQNWYRDRNNPEGLFM